MIKQLKIQWGRTGVALLILLCFGIFGCDQNEAKETSAQKVLKSSSPDLYLKVLGVAQDAGYPQADCKKDCCKPYWDGKEAERLTSCLGVVDKKSGEAWMFDATPDFKKQLQSLQYQGEQLAGIFLTHAHIGHYTGLMHLGREVMGAKGIPVYVMPEMKNYLENNGPWSQLVNLKNIDLRLLAADSTIVLNERLKVTPFIVPHRDEFSETVGYKIEGPEKKVLFIPDINKWDVWERDILDEIKKTNLAFLDATFYRNGEIPGRDMSEIPHPFIEESMTRFEGLSSQDKSKVHFIHFNHTNPVMRETDEKKTVQSKGFIVAEEGMIFGL